MFSKLKPSFEVSISKKPANSKMGLVGAILEKLDLNSGFEDRIISFTVTRNSDHNVDQLSMVFDNQPKGTFGGQYIEIPEEGDFVELSLGYKGLKGISSNVVSFGKFEINSWTMASSTGGDTLSMNASSILLRDMTVRNWDEKNLTVYSLVKKIAKEIGIKAEVSDSFRGPEYKVSGMIQNNESHQQFLAKLANTYDAVFKTSDNRILFVKRGEKSQTQVLTPELAPDRLLSWDYTYTTRNDFEGGEAGTFNLASGAQDVIRIGDTKDNRSLTLKTNEYHASSDITKQALQSQVNSKNRKSDTLVLKLLGDPTFDVEDKLKINLKSVPRNVNGLWIIETVNHSFSMQGFTTDLTCRKQDDDSMSSIAGSVASSVTSAVRSFSL